LIARQAAGGMRDAISLLDQLSSTGTKITLALAQNVLGTATSQTVLSVIASVRDREPAIGLETIHRALDSGADPRSLARQIVDYLRGLMLIQMGNADQVETTADVKKQMSADAASFSTNDVLRMMKVFNTAATDLRGGWQPSLSLELALAEVVEGPEVPVPQVATSTSRSKPKADVLYQTAKPVPETEKEAPKADNPIVAAGDVVKVWKQVAHSLSKTQPNLSALLNSVKMIDVQGKTLLLGFASDVLVSKMDKPEHADILRKALTELLGVELDIRCVVTNAKGKLPPNVSQDGMVAAAINQGGEIVDLQD
jgi:DNA polymerase III subunit gamma/tau